MTRNYSAFFLFFFFLVYHGENVPILFEVELRKSKYRLRFSCGTLQCLSIHGTAKKLSIGTVSFLGVICRLNEGVGTFFPC